MARKLTKEKLLKQLKNLQNEQDVELRHIMADELVVRYIGDERITEAHKAAVTYSA
jgi:hypothetical protein